MESNVIGLMRGSQRFNTLAPKVEAIMKLPAAERNARISASVKRTNDSLWVDDPLDMFIELAGKQFKSEESALIHRLTLAVASGTAEKEQFFNTNQATAGEHITNIQAANKMVKGQVGFVSEIFLTFFDDASNDEIDRIQKEGIFRIQFKQGTDFLTKKALYIPGADLKKASRLGVAQGMVKAADAANADTYQISRVHPQGKGWVLQRFFKLPEDVEFTCYLDFPGTTAVQIACDCELALNGIFGTNK